MEIVWIFVGNVVWKSNFHTNCNFHTMEIVPSYKETVLVYFRTLNCNTRFPLLRFRSALHCGYSGIAYIQDGLFFVLTRARTFKKS
jgi:hypothetical protein